jgi:hypothetical protein
MTIIIIKFPASPQIDPDEKAKDEKFNQELKRQTIGRFNIFLILLITFFKI